MSTDPYPEVSVDESGIVPPQGGRPSEWPKKLRTLTASELDRLTIDNSGRFYWDGKLVNYDTGTRQIADQSADSLDRSMDILDRASFELGGRKSPATIEGHLAEPADRSAELAALNLDVARAQGAAAVANAMAAAVPLQPQVIRSSENTQLTLSRWQTIGAVAVVVLIAIGAFSMATYGYVAARDWGCKTGTFQSGCPAPPPRSPVRTDIPA
ncbi:MAG: hypothetical protein WCG92_20015 [Hyphomicrobiales bacterium]